MKLKRILAAVLTAATLCGLLMVLPAGAANANAGFTDITDSAVSQAAETLRLLGIISGDGTGAFHPDNTLTRAQFCKMAVIALGKGDEAEGQASRTIFKDVLGNNWARGYINLASSLPIGADSEGKGGDMLMMGKGDGSFQPDAVITYAEAVTIMMRMLDYSSKDLTTGANWYDGSLATAKAIGLSDGVSLTWNSPITRGQTALLFHNMLFTESKGGKDPYLTTKLSGKVVKEAIILSLDATTDDGTTGAILTTGDLPAYKTDHAPFDPALAGCRAELVLDKNDKVIAIQPSTTGSQKIVSIISTEATYLTVAGGAKLEVTPGATVYKNGEATTYEKVRPSIKPSTQAVFHYAATGKLEYIFLPTTDLSERAAVAKDTDGNPFSSLVGTDTGYRVVKNGLSASTSDIRAYDVGTYDKATKTLYISDLRLTGVYENVSPSPATPLSVTIMNVSFPVLSTAYEDFSNFKIGDTITLLLTTDGQVAGVVSPTVAKSTTVGVVTKVGAIDKGTAEVTVNPLADLRDAQNNPVALSGTAYISKTSAEKLQGQIVTVSSNKIKQINVSALASSGATGDLDVSARTLGGAPLAENIHIYERVGNGAPNTITFAQLTRATIPNSKIAYVSKDYAGRVDIVVFDDVTGDQYTYGMVKTGTENVSVGSGESGSLSFSNSTISVSNGNAEALTLISNINVKDGDIIGIAASLDKIQGSSYHKASGWTTLKTTTQVSRSAFDFYEDTTSVKDPLGTITTGDMVLPIAGNVQCYNKSTKQWFASVNDAWAYSDHLTIYYDRSPQEGGKVRLVVVE